MEKENYEAPSLAKLGQFGDETGKIGDPNREEVLWHFDTWE